MPANPGRRPRTESGRERTTGAVIAGEGGTAGGAAQAVNRLFKLQAQPLGTSGRCVEFWSAKSGIEENTDMVRLIQHYVGYRRVGLARIDAFRFAWLVAFAGARPHPLKVLPRR